MQVWPSALLLGCIASMQTGAATGAPVADAAPDAGAAVYGKWCSDCHSTAGGPGSMALERKYHGSLPAILNRRSDLSPEYISQVVRHGVSFMPSFRKTEISDAELDRLGTYLTPRSLRNHRRPARATGGE
ncbi:cytochrome c [Novosphingobium sp.]|uniref:c-type cytochrome n=1 Tax=Novosphingobium sp. TaxID=1874826 RepID=UPI003341F28C